MNGLATRNRIRQATHTSVVRELDTRSKKRCHGDYIVGAIGVAGTIIIVLWLLIEHLVKFYGGSIA